MLAEYFSKDRKLASCKYKRFVYDLFNSIIEAESTARNAIEEVRNRQNGFLAKFETIPKDIPVISPAFNWAQSLNQTMLEVKYSTRFDSPACLDIFDQKFEIQNEGSRLYHSAMCRNDKKLLRYELKLDLFAPVLDQPDSYFEDESVGRILINLAKAEQPSRWKRLVADNATKPPNTGVWWEMWEKHEKDLEKHAPEDDDDVEEDDE